MQRLLAFLTFVTLMYTLLGGCSTTSGAIVGEKMESADRIETVEFPELILTDRAGLVREVKLLSLQGRTVTLAPFPYWLLEPEEIPLNHIRSLKFKRHSYPGLTIMLISAEAGFMITGGIMGARAEDSRQYKLALGLGVASALLIGGGDFFTGVWELGEDMYPEYDLATMSEPDKLLTVMRIMGVL